LAAVLRLGGAAWSERFHPDEAWFATFARGAAVTGDWWLGYGAGGALDKPPLALYAQALAMQFTAVTTDAAGVLQLDVYAGERAARLPSALAGVVTVAAIYALARRLYRRRTDRGADARAAHTVGLIAAGIAALSPYGIVYSAAAFTDGLMVMCLTLALACAAGGTRRSAIWAGVWAAAAFACKPQGAYVVPLCAVLLFVSSRKLLPFILACAVGIALVFAWDAARVAVLDTRGTPSVSTFAQAAVNNDPERAGIAADEIAPRAATWLRFAAALLGSPAPIFALAALLGMIAYRRGIDALIIGCIIGYLALHTLLPFNLYDRYLLPLLPLASIAAARGALWLRTALTRFLPSAEVTLVMGALALALINGAFAARAGGVEIGLWRRDTPLDPAEGGTRRADGIDAVAAYLDGRALGAIIYDRWLGWQLGYYMGAWTDKRRVYYPTSEAMAAGAANEADPAPRYFVAPSDAPYRPYLESLARAGFAAETVFERGAFRVYALRR
jgi:4-amino-4-deoxy-L-arabinose transferase-like glycosyltransferase